MRENAGKDVFLRHAAGDHYQRDQRTQHPAGDHHDFQEGDDRGVNERGEDDLPTADGNTRRQGLIQLDQVFQKFIKTLT